MDNNLNNPNNQNSGNNKNNKNNKDNRQMKAGILICIVVALFVLLWGHMISKSIENSTTKEITYDEFIDMLDNGEVDSVEIQSNTQRLIITPKEQKYTKYTETRYTGILEDGNALQIRLEKAGVTYSRAIDNGSSQILSTILDFVIMFGGIFIFMFLMYRLASKSSGGLMSVGRSNAKVYVEKETGVTFKDVAGQEEAKESLTELVDFLHDPGKYTAIGAKLPKGALLVGPPGTGKTLLAKAVAGEAKVPFFSLSGSDFVEMYVGVGASRVRDLFKQAQSMAPCIIFIDEVDAIGKSRDSRYGGGNDEREQTLNQLLSEMDGFDTSKGIVILAATNRPEVLDKALLRPGRFDRRIIVDRPDLKGRVEVLKVHAKNVNMGDDVDLEAIALATSGAVGSDLANMINEAAILAVKKGRNYVTQADHFESGEGVIAGKEKKDRILSKEEKNIVAFHETGHALVSALQKNAEPVQKITIVPRTKGALGYVLQAPEEEKYLMKKEELIARIVTFCAGRAAEEIVFGSVTTGAANDIEQATDIARSMVTRYGMSDKFGLVMLESIENKYLEGRAVSQCSDETATEIDKEVRDLIAECYNKAKQLINENRDILDRIAGVLLEKESITGKEFMAIYNEMKGIVPEEKNSEDDKEVKEDTENKASE
ncbi:MAG: ATP-dependent zinc metalloprotease FtsH [Lachnospiraceae bacterium]|nr:ATP-dependent zinc metalloprotease FtsH [Lachnospiraceae bacterium]